MVRLSPEGSRASGRAWWVGYQAVALAMSLMLAAVCAHAATTFTRLSARAIRTKTPEINNSLD